jgi:hypothetical protein
METTTTKATTPVRQNGFDSTPLIEGDAWAKKEGRRNANEDQLLKPRLLRYDA